MGCPKQKTEEYCYTPTPFDSLISLGDSAIRVLNQKRQEEQVYRDSIHIKLDDVSAYSNRAIQGYEKKLQEKEERKRRFKDTIIYKRRYKYDTIYRRIEVVQLDTIYKDTIIYNSIFKRKLF